jgi:hypothetical protein
MAEEIRTRFKSVRLHIHWPCTVCGGQTSGVNVLNESPDATVRVCEHCLQAGHVDERLAKQAQKTRSLIGRLKVPTYEEWLAEEERVDAERIAEGEEPY